MNHSYTTSSTAYKSATFPVERDRKNAIRIYLVTVWVSNSKSSGEHTQRSPCECFYLNTLQHYGETEENPCEQNRSVKSQLLATWHLEKGF